MIRKCLQWAALCLAILVICLPLPGCGSWKSTAYKSSGSVVITADAGMKAWASYVVSGQAKPEQELAVREAYGRYQKAMTVVIDAGKLATTSDNQSALQVAVSAAAIAQADLITLINSFHKIQ
jgi:hypothetical protein